MKKLLENKGALAELCVIFGLIVVACCSLFRFNYFDGEPGECISISLFGRFELRNIDKVIVVSRDKEWTITDSDLIEQICNETRVAERAGPCTESASLKRIELYSGDKLIRSMNWSECCDQIAVYNRGLTHWIFSPPGGSGKIGYVELSDELMARLNEVMKE